MKITEDELVMLEGLAGEINDGLYAIISQGQHMVEMTRYVTTHPYWVVEEYNLRDEYQDFDTFLNSSFTITVDTSVRSHFKRDAIYRFESRDEAFKHFTDYQFVRNHF